MRTLVVDTPKGTQHFLLPGPRHVLGSGPGADLRLDAAFGLHDTHLLLVPHAEGCWVAVAEAAQGSVQVAGSAFQQGVLAWDTALSIGGLTCRLRLCAPKNAPAPPDQKKRRVRTQLRQHKADNKRKGVSLLLLALLGFGLGIWLLTSRKDTTMPTAAQRHTVPLFPQASPCAEAGPRASAAARRGLHAAAALQESAVFRPQDAFTAVAHYADAAACYRAAGEQSAARRAAAAGRRLRHRIQDQLRHHRLALERALERERPAQASAQVDALLRLLAHRKDAYTRWLRQSKRLLAAGHLPSAPRHAPFTDATQGD